MFSRVGVAPAVGVDDGAAVFVAVADGRAVLVLVRVGCGDGVLLGAIVAVGVGVMPLVVADTICS